MTVADIVDELRDWANECDVAGARSVADKARRAADEITRLRATPEITDNPFAGYVDHMRHCGQFLEPDYAKCTCGLDELTAALSHREKKE